MGNYPGAGAELRRPFGPHPRLEFLMRQDKEASGIERNCQKILVEKAKDGSRASQEETL